MTCISKYSKLGVVFLLLAISGCGGGGGTQAATTTSVSLSADKTQAVASTQDNVTFTATVRDGNGFTLTGKTVNFNAPAGTYPYVSQVQTTTDGTAKINLKYPPVGPNRSAVVTLTAMSDGIISNDVTVTFSNPQQTPANVTLTADKTSVLFNGSDSVVLTATATDAGGLPLAGQAFNANISPTPFNSAINPYTNNDGKATILIIPGGVPPGGTVPNSFAVTANVDGVQSNVVSIAVSTP